MKSYLISSLGIIILCFLISLSGVGETKKANRPLDLIEPVDQILTSKETSSIRKMAGITSEAITSNYSSGQIIIEKERIFAVWIGEDKNNFYVIALPPAPGDMSFSKDNSTIVIPPVALIQCRIATPSVPVNGKVSNDFENTFALDLGVGYPLDKKTFDINIKTDDRNYRFSIKDKEVTVAEATAQRDTPEG